MSKSTKITKSHFRSNLDVIAKIYCKNLQRKSRQKIEIMFTNIKFFGINDSQDLALFSFFRISKSVL